MIKARWQWGLSHPECQQQALICVIAGTGSTVREGEPAFCGASCTRSITCASFALLLGSMLRCLPIPAPLRPCPLPAWLAIRPMAEANRSVPGAPASTAASLPGSDAASVRQSSTEALRRCPGELLADEYTEGGLCGVLAPAASACLLMSGTRAAG